MRIKDALILVTLLALLMDLVVVVFYVAAYMLSQSAYANLPWGMSPFLGAGVLLLLLLSSAERPAKKSGMATMSPYHYRANRF